jgi:uncharacterized protein with von Willebrand factor type A (vWA) domain
MSEQDALLWPIFHELRKQGLPIGIPEYLLAVKTLREGIGLENIIGLRQVCSLLWVKSQEELELFNTLFTNMVEPKLRKFDEPLAPFSEEEDLSKHSSSDNPLPSASQQMKTGHEIETVGKQVIQPRHTFHTVSLDTFAEEVPFSYQSHEYHFTLHLPLDRREVAGLWRHLRQLQRTGPPVDLDVEATINTVCETGAFLRPVLVPRRRNQVQLILLIDQTGSMTPFSLLLDAFIESTLRSGSLGSTHVYYFHDCPDMVLYRKPNLLDPLTLDDALAEHSRCCVLIVSDAGAARGYYDQSRVDETRAFLRLLNSYTYLYAWLNPMPIKRWTATTAQEIAHIAPMFHLNREGLNDAIDILRGHPFPPEVSTDG